ncbi:hypothetical protein AABC73_03820 [Pseudomonas sp. G.S.17]|uniref:hypothetical protein n=1 Tax=Pseudomonas sp. G.S.17 TaxID=3137451 RepID=UPI00311CE13F
MSSRQSTASTASTAPSEARHHILQEGYQRLAKTTTEEGLELLAYCLFITGSLQHYVQQLKSRNP